MNTEKRLLALPAYQKLPPRHRRGIELALLEGISGPRAMRLAGVLNPSRAWQSERVQAVVSEFCPQPTIAPAEPAAPAQAEKTAPDTAENAPGCDLSPSESGGDAVAPLELPEPIVLGEGRPVEVSNLFRNIQADLPGQKGRSTLDCWREQDATAFDSEQAERAELIERIERNKAELVRNYQLYGSPYKPQI